MNIQDHVDLFGRVSSKIPHGMLGAAAPTLIRGTVKCIPIPTIEELASSIATYTFLDGWAMHQSQLVPELRSLPTATLENAGRLVAAEWRSADDRSISIRLVQQGAYVLTEWHECPEGTDWLCDEILFRHVGGNKVRYLRLWQVNDGRQAELRPAFSIFAGRTDGGTDE